MAITDITKPMALDETLQATNGKMDSVISELQGIKNALMLDPSIYHPAGTKTCAELVSSLLIEDNLGDVYNITDSGYTTADFIEGAGKPIYAGDNVSIADFGTGGQHVYKFDLLAGIIDLSNYVQKSNTPGLLKNDGSVDETEYATADDLEGVSDDVDVIKERMDADTTSISGNPISISGLKSNQLAKNPIITLEPIQAGSGTPSPSNIRAISGYDKVEALSCGKNLFDIDNVIRNSAISVSGNNISITPVGYNTDLFSGNAGESGASAKKLYLKAGTYAISFSFVGTAPQLNSIYVNTIDETTLIPNGNIGRKTSGQTFVITESSWICLKLVSNATCTLKDIQIEESSSATSYVPYNKATSISESLGQTVYGATWYPRTGKLSSNMIMINLKGKTASTYATTGVYISNVLNRSGTRFYGICSHGNVRTDSSASYNNGDMLLGVGNATVYWVGILSLLGKTLAEFNTWLANEDVWVCYDAGVENYTEIQLTPHEISLLKDYAYVSTNGTNIALDYHNGEIASLGDVSQVGETVNELGDKISNTEATVNTIVSNKVRTMAIGGTAVKYPLKQGMIICYGRGAMSKKGMAIIDQTNTVTEIVPLDGCTITVSTADNTVSLNASTAGQFTIIYPY